MTEKNNILHYPNPDLVVLKENRPRWNQPETRRHGFHNFYRLPRYNLSLRAANILQLETNINEEIGSRVDVKKMISTEFFSGMAVIKNQDLIFESYAKDFHAHHPHLAMSVMKLTVNLIIGDLISKGAIDPNKKVKEYISEMGSGYSEATIQQVLDMDLENNYSEDYGDVFADVFLHEACWGWRLGTKDNPEISQKKFLKSIKSIGSSIKNNSGYANYKSANTEILAWVAERVSGRSFFDWIIDLVEATGIEGNWYMSTDREGFPAFSGGVSLNARDMARFGQLYCRYGLGVNNLQVSSKEYIEATRNRNSLTLDKRKNSPRYSNQAFTNGTWIGHGGYGGQFLLVNPDTGISVSFFSVLLNKTAMDYDYLGDMVSMMESVASDY
jgi:CubicO group peptidase (beta-lactamase class C family)